MTRNRFRRTANTNQRTTVRRPWWMPPSGTPSERALDGIDLPAGTRR